MCDRAQVRLPGVARLLRASIPPASAPPASLSLSPSPFFPPTHSPADAGVSARLLISDGSRRGSVCADTPRAIEVQGGWLITPGKLVVSRGRGTGMGTGMGTRMVANSTIAIADVFLRPFALPIRPNKFAFGRSQASGDSTPRLPRPLPFQPSKSKRIIKRELRAAWLDCRFPS
jgi:hypothetical protein